MTFRISRGWLIRACLALVALVGVTREASAARPNILFILTDDQGPHAASYLGNKELPTPHLDALAAQGAVLRNAFCVTPVCSPSRASIVSSRYGSELGILDWINPKTEPEIGLNPNTVTWMELLQESGYVTGLMGKWHLGTATRYHPTLSGYQEFMGFLDGGRPTRDAILQVGGHHVPTQGFIVDVVTDGAIEFLKSHKADTFALSVHYREPHSAWLPAPDEDAAPFKDIVPTLPSSETPGVDEDRLRKMIREYYISCRSVDRSVGRLMQTLKELGLDENTIVIFTSDHGYNTGHHGVFHKGNASWILKEKPQARWKDIGANSRPNMWDQSLRVPAIVRWPGVVKAGMVVERTTTHLDWYPTLVAISETALPKDVPVHGRSIVPLLKGETPDWSDEFYSEYSMRTGATVDMRCWRTPQWKLTIDYRHRDRDELYDLANDPNETTNLIGSDRREVQEMRESLARKILHRMQQIHDPLLAELPDPDPQGP
jgi:choline-sulfatase